MNIPIIQKIKSIYILKKILSLLWENKKLDLFKYNKQWKKKLLPDEIEYYKKSSYRYVIIKENGIGEEYILNTNILIYKGEYLKGKRNGKGKEFYAKRNLKFEGEFSNGIKIRGQGYDIRDNIILQLNDKEGKEYYDNKKLMFTGEYYNGRRWNGKIYNYEGKEEYEIKYGKGKGKEYNREGKLIYEGEYINGLRNGKGKEYENGKLIFEGEYINGFGQGKEYDSDGKIIYEGEYLKGKRNGKGKEYNYSDKPNILIFEGYFLNCVKKGIFIVYKNDKKIFEGYLFNDKIWKGKGIEYLNDEIIFEGEYVTGKKWNGIGKEYDSKNKIFIEVKYLFGNKRIKGTK